MVGNDRTGVDDSWFGNDTEGSVIASHSDSARFWVLTVTVFYGTSASNSVLSTGGILRGNGVRCDALEARPAGTPISTVLSAVIFPTPTIGASVSFNIDLMMGIAAAVAVVV